MDVQKLPCYHVHHNEQLALKKTSSIHVNQCFVFFLTWFKSISQPTCLESGLENVGWDGDGPVEDPGHPASKQNAGNAELAVAASGTDATGSERQSARSNRWEAARRHLPFPWRSEEVLQPLVGGEVHSTGRHVWGPNTECGTKWTKRRITASVIRQLFLIIFKCCFWERWNEFFGMLFVSLQSHQSIAGRQDSFTSSQRLTNEAAYQKKRSRERPTRTSHLAPQQNWRRQSTTYVQQSALHLPAALSRHKTIKTLIYQLSINSLYWFLINSSNCSDVRSQTFWNLFSRT